MIPLATLVVPALVLVQPPGASTPATEYRSELSNAGVSLVYRVTPTELTVAQRIRLELTLTVPTGWSVSWPAVGEKLGRAAVVDTGDSREGNTHTRTYTLEPYLPGDDSVPALSVSASPRDPGSQASPVTLTTQPVPLVIKALLSDDDAANAVAPELRDPLGLAEANRGLTTWQIGWIVVFALSVGSVVAAIATRRGKRAVDAAGAALARLDALAAERAPAGIAERNAALDRIAHASREFLQARGVANAVGAATPDLIRALSPLPAFREVAPRIEELLVGIDAARFDPRHESANPAPIAAQLAAIFRSTLGAITTPQAKGAHA